MDSAPTTPNKTIVYKQAPNVTPPQAGKDIRMLNIKRSALKARAEYHFHQINLHHEQSPVDFDKVGIIVDQLKKVKEEMATVNAELRKKVAEEEKKRKAKAEKKESKEDGKD